MDIDRLVSERSRSINASGIRRAFELGAKLKDPINLSIGQPDFPVPDAIKRAACEAINGDRNGYSLTQGVAPLREAICTHLARDVGWKIDPGARPDPASGAPGLLVTSGTSGALWLAFMAMLGPGDEVIVPDPYFVIYPSLASVCDGRAVLCDTYPDFRMTAERVEPLITPRTKFVLLNSPSNPAGVVASRRDVEDLLDLCRRRNILLISDEIYDQFTFDDARDAAVGHRSAPSPARVPGSHENVLLIRGFGKTYGVTGWRMGYCAGPARLIEEMTKLQQYTFVCAPTPLQFGAVASFGVDMEPTIAAYQRRRDKVVQRLSTVTEVAIPGGAFYAFPKVPEHLGITASQFAQRCIDRNVIIIPGGVFSSRDTHLRLSFAVNDQTLDRGLDVLVDLMRG